MNIHHQYIHIYITNIHSLLNIKKTMAQPPPQPPPRKYKRNRRHRIKLLNKKSIWDTPALHNFLLSQNTKILQI